MSQKESQVSDIGLQSQYYDRHFQDFEYANSLQLERAFSILEALWRSEIPSPRILDFGCGPGWLTNVLASFGPTVGVDLSASSIAAAQRRYPVPQFEASDIFQWHRPAGSFDVVVSQEVLEHVADQRRYLDRAADLLRDQGRLILTTPNARTMMAMPPDSRKAWTDQPIEDWRTMDELRELLAVRFTDIHLETITFGMGEAGSYRLVNSAKLASLMSGLGLSRWFERWRSRKGYGLHIVATAQKK
jgi:2-polyprenyl-3-methyl-5-hydroxy-6-metoxy-1,4-benzoquinol methylase